MRFVLPILFILLFVTSSCKRAWEKEAVDTNKATAASAYYSEEYRPQFHFSPPEKWMNDPNGLVHHQGVYHLFYEYYPDDIIWGPMHWG
ncbi:MAG: glycoside hydrolase family 32 protein, partial [Bacteroidia bacterium]|nr:glycoside hydrolase family 32 protein [Bacteroidia bacterium]